MFCLGQGLAGAAKNWWGGAAHMPGL